jgi:carbamoylphosphate synthase small subunit
MLAGFEDITQDLNEYEEQKLLPLFVSSLARRRGKSNAITNKQIVQILKDRSIIVSDVLVRKIISHIRTNCMVEGLLASSSGYWVSEDPREIEKYQDSLKGRISRMKNIDAKMERYKQQLIHKNVKQQSFL